ncbi:MAG: AAA family ATPase [Candidatus Aenigmarchaeota archaeon]|nr:AAA family ATPase [Candidatus Aenigmarchaeota archaeon]
MDESRPVQTVGERPPWRENPFSLRILPQLFVGYAEELNTLSKSVENSEKMTMLIGPTGAGKTTLLKKLVDSLPGDWIVLYINKPPVNPDDFVGLFKSALKPSFWERFFSPGKTTLYNLPNYANRKLKQRKMVLLVDECHESPLQVLEWTRTIADQVNNLSVVMAGLPTLETFLEQNLETLLNRVTVRVELTSLSREDVEELIRKRIEFAGGTGTGPFSREAIDVIYERTGGFPRNVLKMCDDLISGNGGKSLVIDKTTAESTQPPETAPVNVNFIETLPEKQKEILKLLALSGPLSPSEIAEKMGLEDYKTEDHASRSVNNILRRLMDEDCLLREKRGKGFVYKLSPKVRTLLATT